MNDAGSAPAPRVWSLNYHEVTADPRVLKQAEALSAAGYDVTVICDHPRHLPKNEDLKGVKIHRFDWKDLAFDSLDSHEVFDFLAASCPEMLHDFQQLSSLVQERNGLLKGGWYSEVLERSHYKEFTGAKRVRRKMQHLKARYLISAQGVLDKNYRQAGHKVRLLKELRRETEARFRNLHQARSLVFAANLLREELGDAPSIIHAHDIYTLPAGVILARKYGARLIYDAHELETARATNMGPKGADVIEALENACFEHTDALVTVSQSIGEIYAKRFTKRAPAIVMNAPIVGLSPKDALDKGIDIRSRCGLSPDVPLFVYTGGVQREHRGLDKVVAALAHLPECHLATLGPRHNANDAWLQEHARTAGMEHRLHMFDSVPSDHVVGVIASASAAIIPIQGVSLSYQLAMPNKLFEAAAARLFILASDLPDMRRFVEELGIGEVMDHTSAEGIEAALRKYLDGRKSGWGHEDTERLLEQKYSWSAQVETLLKLYEELH